MLVTFQTGSKPRSSSLASSFNAKSTCFSQRYLRFYNLLCIVQSLTFIITFTRSMSCRTGLLNGSPWRRVPCAESSMPQRTIIDCRKDRGSVEPLRDVLPKIIESPAYPLTDYRIAATNPVLSDAGMVNNDGSLRPRVRNRRNGAGCFSKESHHQFERQSDG